MRAVYLECDVPLLRYPDRSWISDPLSIGADAMRWQGFRLRAIEGKNCRSPLREASLWLLWALGKPDDGPALPRVRRFNTLATTRPLREAAMCASCSAKPWANPFRCSCTAKPRAA